MSNTARRDDSTHRHLLAQFEALNLDPFEIISPYPESDLKVQNAQLLDLLDWVFAYRENPSRKKFEANGMLYPPVNPGYGPDEDWYLFERWVRGEPTSWTLDDLRLDLPEPGNVSEQQAADLLEILEPILEERGAVLGLNDGVPARLAYEYLVTTLKEDPIPITGGSGRMVLSGCTGYCPGCFQRSWCETGRELAWPEDAESCPIGD